MIISCKGTRSSVTSAYRNGKKKIPGNPFHEGDQSISREGLNRRKGEIEKMHLYLQPTRHIHKQGSNLSVEKGHEMNLPDMYPTSLSYTLHLSPSSTSNSSI